jgi:hypothetical protein
MGASVSTGVSGPVPVVYHDGASFTETSSGRPVRTVPGSGPVSGFVGHAPVTIVPTGENHEGGFPVYDLVNATFRGTFLGTQGVCAAHA